MPCRSHIQRLHYPAFAALFLNVCFAWKIDIIPIAQLRYSCWYTIIHLLNYNNNAKTPNTLKEKKYMQKFKSTTFGGSEHTSQRTKNMGRKKAKIISKGQSYPYLAIFWNIWSLLVSFGPFFIKNQVFWMGIRVAKTRGISLEHIVGVLLSFLVILCWFLAVFLVFVAVL